MICHETQEVEETMVCNCEGEVKKKKRKETVVPQRHFYGNNYQIPRAKQENHMA